MSQFDKEIIKPKTITEMVEIYSEAIKTIQAGYALLNKAQEMLNAGFSREVYHSFSVLENTYDNPLSASEKVVSKMKRNAWKVFIDMLGIKKILSAKRVDELDKKLEKWDQMPEITSENVFNTMQSMFEQSKEFLQQAVMETYEFLRPAANRWETSGLKTNQKNARFEIGERIILPGLTESGYGAQKFRVNHYHEKNLIALDRVFFALDGCGIPTGYRSPLVDSINSSEIGVGETDYFKYKCHKNQRLHLQFKRMDIVAKINAIAGGWNLRGEK